MSRQEMLAVGLLSVIAAVLVYGLLGANANSVSGQVVAVVAGVACGVVGFTIVMALNHYRSR